MGATLPNCIIFKASEKAKSRQARCGKEGDRCDPSIARGADQCFGRLGGGLATQITASIGGQRFQALPASTVR